MNSPRAVPKPHPPRPGQTELTPDQANQWAEFHHYQRHRFVHARWRFITVHAIEMCDLLLRLMGTHPAVRSMALSGVDAAP